MTCSICDKELLKCEYDEGVCQECWKAFFDGDVLTY